MKNTSDKDKKAFLSEWLEKLQQESWQLELLISGFAIYGLFQSQGFVEELANSLWAVDLDHWFFGHIHVFDQFLLTAWLIFKINLLFHVFVRGLWIGAIGLRYVSGEINIDSLKFSPKFANYYRKRHGSFDQYIEFLEKLASIIFSFSFLLVFLFLAASVLFFLLNLYFYQSSNVLYWLDDSINAPKVILKMAGLLRDPIYYLLLVSIGLVTLDLLSFGRLQRIKNKVFITIYYPIFRILSTMTLAFLWRPLLLNYVDNTFSRRFLIVAFPYVIIMFLFSSMSTGFVTHEFLAGRASAFEGVDYLAQHSFDHDYYEDEWKDEDITDYQFWPYFSMPSKEVTGSFLKVFTGHQEYDGLLITELDSTIFPFANKGLYMEFTKVVGSIWRWIPLEKEYKNPIIEELKQVGDQAIGRAKNWDERDSIIQCMNKKISDVNKQNLIRIKQILTDITEFRINDKTILEDHKFCEFYKHPKLDNEGLLCYIQLDSLRKGRHHLSVNRKIGDYLDYGDDQFNITVPFIYLGK